MWDRSKAMVRSDRSPGFSLLELLVVLVLMSVVAATVIPGLVATGTTDTQAAARTLAAGLRRARSQAIQHSHPQSLTLDVQRREFELSFENRARKLPPGIDLTLFTARSALESAERGAIRFFPDGGSTGGRITVRGPNTETRVDVDWLTGRVSILAGGRTTARSARIPRGNADVYAASKPWQTSVLSGP